MTQHFLSFLFTALYCNTIYSVAIPNSCINQEDIDNLLVKPINEDKYHLLNVKCSNEYMIIDINKDKNWLQYFTSSRLYHYAVYGPERDDHSNWNEWLQLTANHYLVSPDCSSCDISSELNAKYSDTSSYYMTPVGSQCTQIPISRIACDMDFKTYECRVCETAKTRQPGYWLSYPIYNGLNENTPNVMHNFDEMEQNNDYKYGLCMFTIRDANTVHNDDSFQHCKTPTHQDLESEIILPRRKPSIGSNGRFCMCIKPETLENYETDIRQNEEIDISDDEEDTQSSESNYVELYQHDFKDGTYRIIKEGTYKVMEDIIFDFKAPIGYKSGTLQSYNDVGDWWPTLDDRNAYPGAGDSKDSYFLGFWAGITIECNDVVLDLNGHLLAMSNAFYYQQSFFVLIALSSQYFIPGQGPGFFGANAMFAENVIIRNGELGLSSHHGIHGNFNKNILIEDVAIHSFKTHGIQFNGFNNIHIKNVDIGHNVIIDKLSPYYSQMRHLLSTYKRMRDENEEVVNNLCLTFYGREKCVTMNDLINDLQQLLDMAFEYAVFDKKIDENNIDLNVLINAKQTPQTATLYGIFLNYVGSNVIGWFAGSDNVKSEHILLENVVIHDLYHNTYENIAISQGESVGKQRILNCLAAPFNAFHIFGDEQVAKISNCHNYVEENGHSEECIDFDLKYIGNAMADIQIFAFKLINDYGLSWDYCSGGAADMNSLSQFAFENQQFIQYSPLLVTSHDPMIHPGKGVIALRLNGVNNGELNNVKIENIWSETEIGSLLGGTYENVVSQQAPYMNGYSMNMVNGLSLTFAKNIVFENIKLNNLISKTGLSFAIALWYDTQIQISEDSQIEINNIFAGKGLVKSSKYTTESYPNLIPEVCAIRIYDDELYQVVVDNNNENTNNININCIVGHVGCLFDDGLYSHIGDVNNNEKECESLLIVGDIISDIGPALIMMNYFGFILFLLVLIIVIIPSMYYCFNYFKDFYDNRQSVKYSELTPLL